MKATVKSRAAARFVGLLLLALVSYACGSTEIGDLTPILESPPEVVDITAHSVRVTAVTNVDMACAIAYGPTEEYGSLATDTDMAGSGHRDHAPLLTSLQPDTEYHLTFGGIGPDGTVYRYKDLTFRTSPESPSASAKPEGDNLALLSGGARVVGTSSNFGDAGNSDTWGGNQAIDGDPATEWSTNGDGNDAWVEIELPAATEVTAVGFWTRTMGTSAEVHSFRVVSDQGDVEGPFQLEGASSSQYFQTELQAKRLRFEVVESSGGNTGAVEIEVYGRQAR